MANEPNIYHLKYFKTAAELGGIAAAAKKLGVSQPAISQAIRKLEEVLQCELMIHTRNRFKLTEEGKLLVKKAADLESFLENLKNDLRGLQSEPTGPLTIATSSSVAFYLLPALLRKLTDKYPKVLPSVQIGNTQEIVTKVKAGECEVGILFDDGSPLALEKKILHRGNFRCLIAEDLSVKSEEGFLVTRESPGVFDLQKAYRKHSGKEAAIRMEIENWEVIAEMARLGHGIAFLPDFIASRQAGTKIIASMNAWAQKVDYRLCQVHQGSHQLSNVAQIFIKELSTNSFQ
ncbi:MAG: LysR family transcriptional regulator [Bdellovibrionales bacterium]|nr:LysR family transcriptional regulator [Bdellovibrionales bacterium]